MPAYTNETVEANGRRQAVATVLFVVGALVMTYLPSSGQQQVASFLRSTVLRPFVATQEAIITARMRATEADLLRHRVDSMVAAMAAQGPLAEENRRLRALLDLGDKLGPTFRSATLVRPGLTGSESTFLVDAGTTAGIGQNAPVISALGLVGVIRDVRADHAIGMDWTHPDFRAGAMTADGTTYGVVESRRGRFREEDRLVLNGTAFHTRLEDGTVVVTSGRGGVFPRGVPIGLVNGLAEAEGGWRKSYWLTPLVEPGMATHVLVALGASEGGRMDLTPVFPADSVRTEQELVLVELALGDSVRVLSDSLAVIRLRFGDEASRGGAREARGRAAQRSRPTAVPLPTPLEVGGATAESVGPLAERGEEPNGLPAGAGVPPRSVPADPGGTPSAGDTIESPPDLGGIGDQGGAIER